MIKKNKTTYEQLIESMTPEEKKEFNREYEVLLLSEMLLAELNQDHEAIKKLAKAIGIAPDFIKNIHTSDNYKLIFFETLKKRGYNLVFEHDGSYFPLNVSNSSNKD